VDAKLACIAVTAVATAWLASPLQAEVRDVSASGFTIENSVVVPVDASTAWQALVSNVDSWWPKDHTWWGADSKLTIDARAGGCFCELAKDRQAQHMQVVFVDPPKLLRMTGGLGPLQAMGLTGVLEWRMVAIPNGTKITLWYRAGGYTPDDLGKFAALVDGVQALQLGGLGNYLRSRAGESAKQPH
jgi:uncharacterized protein YndB with AHSA1/START domain